MAKEASGVAPVEALMGVSPVYGAGESGGQGMLRITRGEQVRWIWPVHLPGWLAVGWQVTPLAAPLPAVVREAVAAPEAAAVEVPAPEAEEPAAPVAEPAGAPVSKQKIRSRRKANGAADASPAAADAAPNPEPIPADGDEAPVDGADPGDLLIDVLAD